MNVCLGIAISASSWSSARSKLYMCSAVHHYYDMYMYSCTVYRCCNMARGSLLFAIKLHKLTKRSSFRCLDNLNPCFCYISAIQHKWMCLHGEKERSTQRMIGIGIGRDNHCFCCCHCLHSPRRCCCCCCRLQCLLCWPMFRNKQTRNTKTLLAKSQYACML